MTAKGIYEAVLTEMNKLQAPSITLEDFNYFANKAISQYINKRYNIYDVNQQTTDDLRVLKSTTMLTPQRASIYNIDDDEAQDAELVKSLYGATYEVNLPDDYLHMLNCICVFKVNAQHKCYNQGEYLQFGASRLTADAWSQIINNFYMKPSYKRPYYYIHNVNTDVDTPTNPIILNDKGQITSGTDYSQGSKGNSDSKIYYAFKGGVFEKTDSQGNVIKDAQGKPETETVQFNPSTYKFNISDFKSTKGNSLEITVDKKVFIVLGIPVNATIGSIEEKVLGNQMALYTNRYWQDEPIVSYSGEDNSTKYLKLVFIGTKSVTSGDFIIKIHE